MGDYDLLIIAIFGGAIFLLYHYTMYLKTKVPIVISPKFYIEKVIKYLQDKSLVNSQTVVYELGSGWGGFSLAVAKLHPAKVVAYELSPIHVLYSKLKAKRLGSMVKFIRADFFKSDLSDADIIYVYLMPKVVKKLWQKMKAECKPGTMMILLGHDIEGVNYFDKIKIDNGKEDSGIYYIYKV